MTTPLIEAIARGVFSEIQQALNPHEAAEDGETLRCFDDLKVGWKNGYVTYAQAALTAITEAGYEICPKGTMAALDTSRVAIDDWLNTYAHDMCDEKRVKEARDRIYKNGGTLAYIARIQEHNRSISAAQGDG